RHLTRTFLTATTHAGAALAHPTPFIARLCAVHKLRSWNKACYEDRYETRAARRRQLPETAAGQWTASRPSDELRELHRRRRSCRGCFSRRRRALPDHLRPGAWFL